LETTEMTKNPSPTTNATMKEKAEVLRNDQRVRSGSTFLDHTHSDEGGRFAKPTIVIGSDGAAQYPMAAPNWSADPTGVEPPLGFDVNAVEPVGEQFEIERHLTGATASASDAYPSVAGDVEAPLAVGASPAEVEPPVNPTPKLKGRLP
jgi:hypothetical protein